MTYAALVWWTRGLEEAAGLVASALLALPAPRDRGLHQEQLQLLGAIADSSRSRTSQLIAALSSIKTPLLDANREVSTAHKRAAGVLQQTQEEVGGLHEHVGRQERQIAQLGLFGAHRKQDLLTKLHALQKERAAAMARSSRFQEQLGALDALIDEGAWLDVALAGAITSLDKMRSAWTRFGSGMSQLAADKRGAPITVAAGADPALERADAIQQWTMVERAARRFAARSTADFGEVRKP